MNESPLDVAAQVTQIAWTLQESPDDRYPVEAVLNRALKLGGLNDINTLKIRKSQGKTVFGVVPSYPQASASDVKQLRYQIQTTLSELREVEIFKGLPVPVGNEWEWPDIPASTHKLEDLL